MQAKFQSKQSCQIYNTTQQSKVYYDELFIQVKAMIFTMQVDYGQVMYENLNQFYSTAGILRLRKAKHILKNSQQKKHKNISIQTQTKE